MPNANYTVGQTFPLQFAWKLPQGDYLRAVFDAKVLDTVPAADKYIVQLTKLVAGRQESHEGEMRTKEELSHDYWALVGNLIGNKVTVAYEVDDGHALHMRLATLTGEHNFFTRYEKLDAVSEKVKRLLENKENNQQSTIND
ncbi:MAG: hypothetical protein GY943_19440 [Chloroflexi bacterium]|nr:hypothetical protein [Chloroflexota bacterium]